MDGLADRFGRRLRSTRRAHGLTQQRVADLAGLTRRAVQYLEEGQRVARLDTLLALATALEVEAADLLRGL